MRIRKFRKEDAVSTMKHFDVIVIGSGISGLNFALRAAEKNQRVLIVTKKKIAESSTNFAQGGIAAVLSQLDDIKKHIRDTLVAGSFHNNKRAVPYMVRRSRAAVMRLIELGVPFATLNGKLLLTREGGHSERRIAFVSDHTGQAIEKVLVDKVRKNKMITLYEHTFAAELLVKNKVCYGVQIIRGTRIENVYASKTVLATGGIGQLYAHTTNPAISTGDGLAMAARAGCSFRDLEFVQFHPTALHLKGAPPFLISEAVRGEGAHLVNSNGRRFMKKYHTLGELAPRDIVSRAIFEEEKNGPVYLDLRHKAKEFCKTRFPTIFKKLKSYGIDMGKDPVPVSPAAHYLCGGIKVNLKGETSVKDLYAFGEVAGTGVHGANRLASNSLLEALVFSDNILAGENFPVGRNKNINFKIPKVSSPSPAEKKKLREIRMELQKIMWKNVGIVREKKILKKTLELIQELKKKLASMKCLSAESLETGNMIKAAALITQAALKRRKSLGCHYRID